MKRTILALVLLMLVATLVSAGTKRVEIIRGFATITLDGADSTGFLNAFRPVQISEMTNSGPVWQDRSWDRMVGSVIMPNLTPGNADSISGENAVDTLIVNYNFISSWYTYQAETDTTTLPGTTLFVIDADMWADYTESIYGDSTAATVKPKLTGDFLSLLMDQFQMVYYVSDTAGTNGTTANGGLLTGTLQWFFKFYEDD